MKSLRSAVNAACLITTAFALAACGGGSGGGGGGSAAAFAAAANQQTAAPAKDSYEPLFPPGTELVEQIQYREPDGTLVTMMGSRTTERHARERGEDWNLPDTGPGRYFTYPTFYFQNRTFGLEIRDTVPAGGKKVEFFLRVNDGTFDGTTFSLFRNILNPEVRDYGWSLNGGFNNAKEGNMPLCHAGQPKEDCKLVIDSNWRTDPHSPLKVGDRIELAPAPRLKRDPVIDGGGSRYYSFEQLYVVGVGMRPWYGVAPNLDSEALPDETLLGGQASVSYNYSEEPMRGFQQMANNIGIANTKRFVQGRRLFHTSFADGKHSEHENDNPVFAEHAGQLGPRYNQTMCIACHTANGRSTAAAPGVRLDTMSFLTGSSSAAGRRLPHPNYGLTALQRPTAARPSDFSVTLKDHEITVRTLPDGEKVELRKPIFTFKGPAPVDFSARQAPQVIGLGLLEAVPEETLLALADPTDRDGDGIRGIANIVRDPETGVNRVGRFGWKASKASLRHQAADALINDMGVTSSVNPARSCQRGAADCRATAGSANVSIPEAELQRLSHYLSLLGVPAQRSLRSGFPADARVSVEHDVNPQQIERGKALFTQARCVACHVAQMKTGSTHPFAELRDQTIRPYSDLLLHAMGPGLADGIAEGKAAGNMWRTPPLWGIGSLPYVQGGAANARYLHDGRARTLTEAILWHGGEADDSRSRFEKLPKADRDALTTFLGSL